MSEQHKQNEGKLRELAYRLWEEAGRPEGRQDEFWHLARMQLGLDERSVPNDDLDVAGKESFPASDPVNHM